MKVIGSIKTDGHISWPKIRPIVFWMPLAAFLLLVITSLLAPQSFLLTATKINNWILEHFSNLFAFAAFAFLLTCFWTMLSPLGRIKIGGKDAKPLLSRWNWMAITITTTIAIGILFWATAEPIYHLYNPGGAGIEPGSVKAAEFSMVSLFMHWSFTPYAIYTVPGLTFALVYYNLKMPFSLSSPISVLIRRPLPKIASDSLDGIAILSLLFGLSTSLDAGILSISGGIDRLTPLSSGPVLLGLTAFAIVFAFFISSASGLHKGIRILSDINVKIYAALILFIFIAGPTVSMLQIGEQSLVQYARELVPRSILLEPFNDRAWLNSWTVFYFANWMAWAPLTAMFLGRIAQGYTVRAYIMVNLIIPAMFSILWMSIFGGFALDLEINTPQILKTILDTKGPEHILYAVLDNLPLAGLLAGLICLVSFLSYVTAADSNIDVISTLCLQEAGEETQPRSTVGLKLIWALAVGFAAWIMTTLSGIDGVKMLSNLGGFPALFILITFNIVLIMLGTVKRRDLI